ncbi:hypothetical protein AKJ40_01550 [candidate division MSBL1 archaeon SCGC-AAA259M10]|uniref:Uncharacterized protein n=1 Tax=candidate division MSBL1 archaeon SCGC-AAA259M10 TaxID=1698270 RepID=A0A133V1I4_9EURY|nr:hypothetical protein AKJ40_01550 [candidate division MSBL1 archaeon SCGC-AAA259M10]
MKGGKKNIKRRYWVGEKVKPVRVVAITVLILTLLSPVATGQHPEKDFSISWRRIGLKRVDNFGFIVTENFSAFSKRGNAENIVFMADRNVENLTVNRDLEKTREGFFYKFRLEEPVPENQSLVLQVKYYSSDLSFSRPVYYSCENVVVSLKNFEDVEIESSVPVGRKFSIQFGDNVSIRVKNEEGQSETPPTPDIDIEWVLLIALSIFLLLLIVSYFNGWGMFGSTPTDRAPTRRGVLERLEEDFENGKIPEKAYENILERLREEKDE